MELAGNKPGMISQFNNFDQLGIREAARVDEGSGNAAIRELADLLVRQHELGREQIGRDALELAGERPNDVPVLPCSH